MNRNISFRFRTRLRFLVLNATFNNISVISWRSVLLAEETREPGENHRPVASHWQTLSHNVVPSSPRHASDLFGVKLQSLTQQLTYLCVTIMHQLPPKLFREPEDLQPMHFQGLMEFGFSKSPWLNKLDCDFADTIANKNTSIGSHIPKAHVCVLDCDRTSWSYLNMTWTLQHI